MSEAQHRLPLGSEVELAATASLAGSSVDHSHPEKVVSNALVARGYRVNWSVGIRSNAGIIITALIVRGYSILVKCQNIDKCFIDNSKLAIFFIDLLFVTKQTDLNSRIGMSYDS